MRFPREMRRTCERERGREGERMAHTRRQRSLHTGVIHTVSIGVFAPYDNSLRNADRSASTKYTITVCSRYERVSSWLEKRRKLAVCFAFSPRLIPPTSLSPLRLYRFRYRPPLSSPPFIFHPCCTLIYIHTYIHIYIYCSIERRAKARPSSRKSVPSPRRRRRRRRRPKGSSTTEILA